MDKRVLTCAYCGKITTGRYSASRRFCDKSCASKQERDRAKNTKTGLVCANCGSSLSHFHALHHRKYCNRACYAISMRKQPDPGIARAECVICTKPLRTGSLYCSVKCAQVDNPRRDGVRDALIRIDLESGNTLKAISEKYGISPQRVQQIGKQVGFVWQHTPKKAAPIHKCAVCDRPCPKYRSVYCSDECYKLVVNNQQRERARQRHQIKQRLTTQIINPSNNLHS